MLRAVILAEGVNAELAQPLDSTEGAVDTDIHTQTHHTSLIDATLNLCFAMENMRERTILPLTVHLQVTLFQQKAAITCMCFVGHVG